MLPVRVTIPMVRANAAVNNAKKSKVYISSSVTIAIEAAAAPPNPFNCRILLS